MFELETALANWKQSFTTNDSVSSEEALELESHLRESVTDLSGIGLSQREAFLVGADRLGHPSVLEQEYAKVNVEAQWRKPIFWMLTGYIGMMVAQSVVSAVVSMAATAMALAGAGGNVSGLVMISVMALLWISLAVVAYRQSRNVGSRGDRLSVKWLVAAVVLLVVARIVTFSAQVSLVQIAGMSWYGEALTCSQFGGWAIHLCLVVFCFVAMYKFREPAVTAFD